MLLGMDLSISKCGGPDICQDPTTFTPMATYTHGDGNQEPCGAWAVREMQHNTCATDPGHLATIAATCCSDG